MNSTQIEQSVQNYSSISTKQKSNWFKFIPLVVLQLVFLGGAFCAGILFSGKKEESQTKITTLTETTQKPTKTPIATSKPVISQGGFGVKATKCRVELIL